MAVLSNSNDNNKCSSKKDRSFCIDYYCLRKKVIIPSTGLRKNKMVCSLKLTNEQTTPQKTNKQKMFPLRNILFSMLWSRK